MREGVAKRDRLARLRMDLELVEVFCHVYEHGSFSKAAAHLRLSQPTVSGHVKNLESYVGTRLLDRLPRRILPTRAGEILYRHGRAILDQKEAAIRELSQLINLVEGPLVIASSTIPGEYLLPQRLAMFQSRFPGVRVELQISDSSAVRDLVLSGKTEIGFAGAKFESVGLDYAFFGRDEIVVVARNDEEWKSVDSIGLHGLRELPLLAREPGSGTRLAFEKGIDRPLTDFNIIACLSSTSAIKEAVRAGLGVAVLSLLAIRSEVASGEFKVIRLQGVHSILREFFVLTNRRLTHSPVCRAFLDFIDASCTERAVNE